MSTTQSEIQDYIAQLLRDSAQRYGDAVAQYGSTFIAYGKGEIDTTHLAESMLKLAMSESRILVDAGISLSTTYAKWALSLAGVRDLGTAFKPAETSADAAKKCRA